jgi:hypothetical protein
LVRELQSLKQQQVLRERVLVPDLPQLVIDVARGLIQVKGYRAVAPVFRTAAEGSSVDAAIAARTREGTLDSSYEEVMRTLELMGVESDWSEFVQAVQERLGAGTGADPDEVVGGLGSLFVLGRTLRLESAEAALQTLAQGPHLLDKLEHAKVAENFQAKSFCVLALLLYNPTGATATQAGNSPQGQSTYQAILASPDQHKGTVAQLLALVIAHSVLEDILNSSSQIGNPATVGELVGRVIEQEHLRRFIRPDVLISRWVQFTDLVPEKSLETLLTYMARELDLFSSIRAREFEMGDIPLHLAVLNTTGGRGRAAYVASLGESLRALPDEAWREALSSDTSPLVTLMLAVKEIREVNLERPFSDALLTHVASVIAGETPPSKWDDLFGEMLEALEENERLTFLRNLRDRLIDVGQETDISVALRYYGAAAAGSHLLEEKADDIVRRLGSAMVGRGELAEIEWLVNAVRAQDLRDKAESESVRALQRRIETRLGDDDVDSEAHQKLEDLNRLLSSRRQRRRDSAD